MSKQDYFPFLTERGLEYSEDYDKTSDSSCVYKYRFSNGSDYIEFRIVVGDIKINCVAFVRGEYRFPNLAMRHKKITNLFKIKHVFKKATEEDWWRYTAELVKEELKLRPELFGLFK